MRGQVQDEGNEEQLEFQVNFFNSRGSLLETQCHAAF